MIFTNDKLVVSFCYCICIKSVLDASLYDGLHGSTVDRTVTSSGLFSVEFACSPCVCVGFLPQSNCKNMLFRLIGNTKSCLGYMYINKLYSGTTQDGSAI